MVNVSVTIPVYNEIRFIQKTLESVIGDADEIILSDNASTDGTSDICQSFASKYPEIKYTRQKENIGCSNNFLFCCNQASGKYIRNIGAHDMISIGSNHSMSLLLDKNTDVVMVYPKYVIALKEDYSFHFIIMDNEFGNDLKSDLASVRIKSIIQNYGGFAVYFGLYRAEILKKVINNPRIFQHMITDGTLLSSMAAIGKFISDERSIFFRMNQDHNSTEGTKNRWARMILNPSVTQKEVNLSFWPFAGIAENYDLVLGMFNNDPLYCNEIFNILLSRNIEFFCDSELTLENMPPIINGKKEFCQNLMTEISKNYYKIKTAERKKLNKEKKIRVIKKIIKCILPYGLYRIWQLYLKNFF